MENQTSLLEDLYIFDHNSVNLLKVISFKYIISRLIFSNFLSLFSFEHKKLITLEFISDKLLTWYDTQILLILANLHRQNLCFLPSFWF